MKTNLNKTERTNRKIYDLITLRSLLLIFIIMLSFTGCTTYNYYYSSSNEMPMNIETPEWAPAYEDVSRVQYYFLPDIQVYYDVWNRRFIYPYEGSWMFGSYLPSMYSWYDLNTCFVILIKEHTYRPWMHHDHYCSNYPKHYYHDKYKNHKYGDRHLRGYNENRDNEVFGRMGEQISNRNDLKEVEVSPANIPITTDTDKNSNKNFNNSVDIKKDSPVIITTPAPTETKKSVNNSVDMRRTQEPVIITTPAPTETKKSVNNSVDMRRNPEPVNVQKPTLNKLQNSSNINNNKFNNKVNIQPAKSQPKSEKNQEPK